MTRQSTTGPLASGTLRTRTHLTAILCATAALAGCSGGDETTAPIATMPALPASSAPTGPEATVKKTALDVYQGYWREMQAYYADRDGTTADLKQYAASEALASAENDAEYAHGRGRIYIGLVVVSKSTVIGTDLGSKTPKVMLSSCLDVSRWRPVIADNRKPVGLPTNRLTKYLIASTLEKWPQGWRVVRDEPQDKRC
ncbi:hypothetical protein AB0G76_31160 [Streptomyces asoensis]|uniref:hypothetical protein n=1 Tax=Streptomyces asoensis TaxID=249586 RepID=UPI0033E6B9FE